MAQVRITDSSGTTRSRIPFSKCVWEETGLNVNQLGRITISRADLNDFSTLEPGRDRVYIEDGGNDLFGGILRTPGRNGGKPELIVDGFSQYADDALPVPLGQEKVSVDDSAMITEVVNATPQLSAGTINTVEPNLTFVFSGISQRDKARKVAEAAAGELVFNVDRTVDYVDSRGSDKTATTLSPANGSFVENQFTVDRDAKHGRSTHLKIYGAGEGSHQIEATIVPNDDPASYPGKATYSNPNWSDGDVKIWDGRSNKDVKRTETAQSWGQKIAAELQETEVTVETTVKGNEVKLGDTFHLSHPEEGVDEDLRAVEVTTVISASGGTRYEVIFSNYSAAHMDAEIEDYRDIERYNLAFEGDLTQIQQGPGRGPVAPGSPYSIYVYYPDDVRYEVDAQVLIKGTSYRSYHAGAASGGGTTETTSDGGGVTETSDANDDHGVVTAAGSSAFNLSDTGGDWETLETIEPPGDYEVLLGGFNYSGDFQITGVRLKDVTENTYYPTEFGVNLLGHNGTVITVPEDAGFVNMQYAVDGSTNGVLNLYWQVWDTHTHDVTISDHDHTVTVPSHTHTPLPGIVDFTSEYPSDVDVIVNGSSQNESLGSGSSEFEEVVDIGGELSQGWNTIQLTSDTIGHLDATMSADLFRQSL